jgi:hypothetical protein
MSRHEQFNVNQLIVGTINGLPFPGGIGMGKVFHVAPVTSSGVNFRDQLLEGGVDPGTIFSTVAAAEDACVAGRNDTVFVNQAAYALTAHLDWDKAFTHLIGVGAPIRVAQRARITCATAADVSPMFHVSGQGCIFYNLMFSNDGVDTGNLITMQVDSQSNYFGNCYFANGSATNAIAGGAALALGGSSTSLYNVFERCTIGSANTISSSTYRALLFNGVNTKSTLFKDCHFTLQASAATVAFVELNSSGTGNDTYILFDGCFFRNVTSTSLTSAFVIPAGQDSNTRQIDIMPNCMMWGAANWDSGNTGVIKTTLGTYTAGGNSGIAESTAT